ncbi:MAG: hydroxymethylglutaryl-CoA reductase, degradative [Schleiferiaceae bacterium]|nr:hydroxymethylglutaryl-CoA reductase, degradative [Schleiferiaceae bacterium]
MEKRIKGFSKLSKQAKMEWLAQAHLAKPSEGLALMQSYMHSDASVQKKHDEFIENTVANYFLPFGVAPNFLINGQVHTVPMAIEESSVVAAAAKSAQFWMARGGFHSHIISSTKIGHIHFMFDGESKALKTVFAELSGQLKQSTDHITANMEKRGGGILDIQLLDKTDALDDYYQVEVRFDTCDSMGANFINSCLEEMAKVLKQGVAQAPSTSAGHMEVVMCILSNYTPECLVRCEVRCPLDDMVEGTDMTAIEFAHKFQRAVRIAEVEPYRAATHNKGIMNGIDAVILATGNDFRAVEAACHAYACRDGQYRSLTHCRVDDGMFHFWIEIPLSLGTVGGLTQLHPLVKMALEILGNPGAHQLMMIVAASGLAQNFAALRALTTTGIQKGHMKMHLLNILNQLGATETEKEIIAAQFAKRVPHHADVVKAFYDLRGLPVPGAH